MAFVNYKSTNNAQGTLLAGIAAGATAAILATGEGELFPSTFPFFVKCEKYDTALNNYRVLKREIWKVTARTDDTLTIVRSSGTCPPDYATLTPGTTAFSFDVGDTISHVITAEQEKDNQDEIARLETAKLDKAGWQMTGALLEAKWADIASASTVNLATATGNFVHITGTTTITGLGTVTAGPEFVLVFDGILTLTHNGTSLILPTAANITTQAWDRAYFRSEWSGNWICTLYQRADGTAISLATKDVFTSYMSANYNLTTWWAVQIPFNSEIIDSWNNFNTTTYKFIAPTSWYYQFSVYLQIVWATASDLLQFTLVRSWWTGKLFQLAWSDTVRIFSWSFIYNLSAWEEVYITWQNATWARWLLQWLQTYSTFEGIKL